MHCSDAWHARLATNVVQKWTLHARHRCMIRARRICDASMTRAAAVSGPADMTRSLSRWMFVAQRSTRSSGSVSSPLRVAAAIWRSTMRLMDWL